MNWLEGASRWIIESYRQGLSMACPVQCRERIGQHREQVRAAIKRKKRRILH